MAGRFISFEGGEGAGKSTQVALLAARLEREHGLVVSKTREPGGTPAAEEVRRLFVTGEPDKWDRTAEALLVNAARSDHCRRRIRPALERGEWVICDRFVDSTFVYQGLARGVGIESLERLHSFATDDLWPDLTIVIDVPIDDGLLRAYVRPGSHQEDRFERHAVEFHEAVRAGFLEIAGRFPERCVVVDGRQPIETVEANIWRHVHDRLMTG